MTDHLSLPTLVVGATGKTGRRIVERLTERGLPVRAGSRSADPPFDWEDRATWPAVLDGVGAVYISFYPDLAMPGAAKTLGAFAGLAAEQGAQRLVLVSGRGEDEALHGEEAVRASGVATTVLRAAWFNQNFSESFMADGIAAGTLALPVDTVREPFVDAEDIADVAVAALTEEGHAGELYELTGPRLLTFADAVGEIAAASGREIAYVPITIDDFRGGLAEEGLPDDIVELEVYLFTDVLDGRNESLTDGVQRALGRPPRDFAEYARATDWGQVGATV